MYHDVGLVVVVVSRLVVRYRRRRRRLSSYGVRLSGRLDRVYRRRPSLLACLRRRGHRRCSCPRLHRGVVCSRRRRHRVEPSRRRVERRRAPSSFRLCCVLFAGFSARRFCGVLSWFDNLDAEHIAPECEKRVASNEVMSPSTRKGKGFIGVVVVVVSFRSRIVVVIRDPSLLSSLRRRWLRRRRL